MRILVFGMSGTTVGGIESFLLNMNEHMSPECLFDYVILEERCCYENRIEAKGGHIYRLTSYRKNPFAYVADLISVLKQHKSFGNVAYFNLFSMCHVTAVILAKIMGYRVVLHSHNNNIPNKSRLYRLLHRINRCLFRKMDCVRLTNSPASARFMFGDVGTQMIYNAIDVDKYKFNATVREELRAELKIKDKIVYGFVGRLMTEKNPLFLVEIFNEIQKKQPDSVLMIAGDGNLRGAVENKIESFGLNDSVLLLGNRNDADRLYKAIDVFILPSLFEGLGIVLIEAQCAGLPCITSEGVVPSEAKATELLEFVPLQKGAEQWAQTATMLAKRSFEKDSYAEIIKCGRFNICTEAKRLEAILINARVPKEEGEQYDY